MMYVNDMRFLINLRSYFSPSLILFLFLAFLSCLLFAYLFPIYFFIPLTSFSLILFLSLCQIFPSFLFSFLIHIRFHFFDVLIYFSNYFAIILTVCLFSSFLFFHIFIILYHLLLVAI